MPMTAATARARGMFYFQPDHVLEHAPRTGNTHSWNTHMESPGRACPVHLDHRSGPARRRVEAAEKSRPIVRTPGRGYHTAAWAAGRGGGTEMIGTHLSVSFRAFYSTVAELLQPISLD